MDRSWVGLSFHLTLAVVVAAGGGGALAEDTYRAPRTAFGHPDLQGGWSGESMTPIERPPGVEHLVADPDEHESLVAALLQSLPEVRDPDFDAHGVRALAKVRGEYRTSVIVDPANGRVPYTEAGLELVGRVRASFVGAFDDPEQRPLPERCLESLGFAPMRTIPIFIPQKIHQTRDHVLILTEDAMGLRTIHLHGELPPDELRSIEGYSRGRWDGDTLVRHECRSDRQKAVAFPTGKGSIPC